MTVKEVGWEMNQDIKTLFILGAGASKEAGAPLMSNFLDVAEILLAEGRCGANQTDFELVFSTRSKLQAVYSKSRAIDLDNLEAVFAAFEMGHLVGRLGRVSKRDIHRNVASLGRLILRTLEETISFPYSPRSLRVSPPRPYGDFANLIRDFYHSGQRCAIITFNYDVSLDYAIALPQQGEGKWFENARRKWGEFVVFHCDYCLENTLNSHSTSVPVMKLHGSLNWVRNGKQIEVIEFWNPRTDSFRRFDISKADSPRKLGLYSNTKREPMIIPPTWSKAEHHRQLANVWRKAAESLSTAENIIVCGYSLPESDYFFRYLFAIGSMGDTTIKRFYVFDPDSRVESRFEDMLSERVGRRFRFRSYTFEQAIMVLSGVDIRTPGQLKKNPDSELALSK